MITNESRCAHKFPPLKLLFSIKSLIYDRVPSVYWRINRGIKSRSETQFQRTKYSIIATPERCLDFFEIFIPSPPPFPPILLYLHNYRWLQAAVDSSRNKTAANYPASRESRYVYSSRFLTTHRKKKKKKIVYRRYAVIYIPDNGDNITSLTSGSIPNDFYDVIPQFFVWWSQRHI